MTSSMVIGENSNAGKQIGRRKSTRSESTQKKNKLPQRGMGIAQLERLGEQERLKEMTLHPLPNPSFNPYSTDLSNGAVQFRYRYPPVAPSPTMLFNRTGSNHGPNAFVSDHPSVIRFENSKELSSTPNYIKCASDGCGVCHKKIRIHGGSKAGIANQFRNFAGNNNHGVVEMIDVRKSRYSSGQVTEYEFFPGKGGGTTTSTWCGSGGSIGLRGGEGSCVTAVTGNEEGSISSVDLSLKLSY